VAKRKSAHAIQGMIAEDELNVRSNAAVLSDYHMLFAGWQIEQFFPDTVRVASDRDSRRNFEGTVYAKVIEPNHFSENMSEQRQDWPSEVSPEALSCLRY
jgi:hypothetical protein